MDDSTFRAYRNKPSFLRSILPLSAELDFILSRIFECDPRKRIQIPELRNLILGCTRFTTRSTPSLPPTPPNETAYTSEPTPQVAFESFRPFAQCSPLATPASSPPYTHPISAQHSTSSRGSSISDSGSAFSTGTSSSMSSCGSCEELPKVQEINDEAPSQHLPQPLPSYVAPQSMQQLYGYCRPMDPASGTWMPHPIMAPVAVF